LGQLVLKKYRTGTALILMVTAGLSVIIYKAVQLSLVILQQIESEGGGVNIHVISQAASEASSASTGLAINLSFLLVVVCWVYGIVNAYSVGRQMDARAGTTE